MPLISDYSKIGRINGSLQRGGWEMHLEALSDTDLLVLNQRVVLDWLGMFGTGTPEGEDDRRTAFDGHVVPQRFSFDRLGSIATFIAQTTDGFLRNGWLQGIGFQDRDAVARDNYHQFDSVTGVGERMTMGRIVRHLLGFYDTLGVPPATNPDWVAHTNLVYHATENPQGWIDLSNVTTAPFADPANLEGTMRVDRYIVRETNNLWQTIRQIATNEFFVAYFDKNNSFHYMRHPMYGAVLPGVVTTFDESFVVGKPVVEISDTSQVRQVRLHAVTDDGNTLHSDYPDSTTHVYGNVPEQTYIRCNSQDALDEWARVRYGWLNREFTVRWTAPGLCGLLFDILDRVNITYTGTTANGVHIDWTDKKFWIHEITVSPNDARSGFTTFHLEAESIP